MSVLLWVQLCIGFVSEIFVDASCLTCFMLAWKGNSFLLYTCYIRDKLLEQDCVRGSKGFFLKVPSGEELLIFVGTCATGRTPADSVVLIRYWNTPSDDATHSVCTMAVLVNVSNSDQNHVVRFRSINTCCSLIDGDRKQPATVCTDTSNWTM